MIPALGPESRVPDPLKTKAGDVEPCSVHRNPAAATSLCQMQVVLCSFTDSLFCTSMPSTIWILWLARCAHVSVSLSPLCPVSHCFCLPATVFRGRAVGTSFALPLFAPTASPGGMLATVRSTQQPGFPLFEWSFLSTYDLLLCVI